MAITIERTGRGGLHRYDQVPIHFEVRTELAVEVVDGGLGGLRLVEQPVDLPYVKDYDRMEGPPSTWTAQYDMRGWGIFLALDEGRPVGGAMVATDAHLMPLAHFQRDDLAVLWDLRVHPDRRRQRIGSRLLHAAGRWARGRGYRTLAIETQNVNVPACRFYASQGCDLVVIHRSGYARVPEVAHEVMLVWYLAL